MPDLGAAVRRQSAENQRMAAAGFVRVENPLTSASATLPFGTLVNGLAGANAGLVGVLLG